MREIDYPACIFKGLAGSTNDILQFPRIDVDTLTIGSIMYNPVSRLAQSDEIEIGITICVDTLLVSIVHQKNVSDHFVEANVCPEEQSLNHFPGTVLPCQ